MSFFTNNIAMPRLAFRGHLASPSPSLPLSLSLSLSLSLYTLSVYENTLRYLLDTLFVVSLLGTKAVRACVRVCVCVLQRSLNLDNYGKEFWCPNVDGKYDNKIKNFKNLQ